MISKGMRSTVTKLQLDRYGSSKNGHANVGAAPISSSAMNSSTVDDDDRPLQISSTNANQNRPSTSNYNHPQMNSPGGIMSFIFGGGGNGTKTPGKTNINGIFRSPRASSSLNGGPPSIVKLPQVPDNMRQTDAPPTDREKVEMEIIKSLIESYFSIVRKNFIDMVPKTIMYFLVNHVRDAMQNELVAELYRDAEVQSLMKEAEDVAQRRRTCVEMKDLLTKALEIVNEVRDFNTFK